MGANTTVFQGNVVRTPEFANTQGTDIINFTLANTRKYKQKESTCFINCVAYGQTAQNIGKFFDKGDPMIVVGRLHQNNWQDQQGNKRSQIVIVVNEFHFCGQTGGNGNGGGNQNRNQNQNRGGGNRNQNQNNNQGGNQNYGNQNNNQQGNYQNNNGGNQQQGQQQQYTDDIPF